MTPIPANLDHHAVVSAERWIAARKALLAREKEVTRLRDELAAARRALPWERVEKQYVFDTPDGPRSLADLFEGKRQLIVQHFMLGPGWEEGCPSCSFMADHADGMTVHLARRDTAFVAISRATLAEIERFRRRMGWRFRWVSSNATSFNHDFHVSFTPAEVASGAIDYNYERGAKNVHDELPGISVFYKDDAGALFHTYSTFGRGVEVMMGTYAMLDLTPAGRGERDVPHKMEWVRHHDRYAAQPGAKATGACCSHG